MADFWVGQFRVDVSRAQIVLKDDIISLEPRVLKVLLILAEKPGEVVTHETLLERAWPNMVVAPNAVQRCIGQLRKALGDDAKQQKMIATHPKVGYSLVAKVERPELAEELLIASGQQPRSGWDYSLPLVILLSLLVFGLIYLPEQQQPFSKLSPITSTQQKEYYPSYSPDGRYLVYNRFVSVCGNELWAKDLTEKREFKLTAEPGYYGAASWSPDGNQVAFTSTGGCDAQHIAHRCRNISALSFPLAKAMPQTPREILACDNNSYGAINWLSNNALFYVDSSAGQGHVKLLTLDTGKSEILFQSTEFQPKALSYSANHQKLAITVHDQIQNTAMFLLDMPSRALEQISLDIPAQYSHYLWWDPIWHPVNETLFAAAENSLFEIDSSGNFSEYALATVENIYSPSFHPDGESFVAVMGDVDLNIESYSFEKTAGAYSVESTGTLYHSTVEDMQAKYQPGQENISFISNRSGDTQIWFAENNSLRQLSQFDPNSRIESYSWSPDGGAIALAINGEVKILTLDGLARTMTVPFKVVDVYQWLNEQEILLSAIFNEDQAFVRKTIRFNIETQASATVYQGFSNWAQLYGDTLYLTDWSKDLFRYQKGELLKVEQTAGLKFSEGFMLKGQELALFSPEKVWLYSLQSDALSPIEFSGVNQKVANLSDINFQTGQLLMSMYTEFRKDLILFEK